MPVHSFIVKSIALVIGEKNIEEVNYHIKLKFNFFSSRNNSLDRNMTPPLNASLLSTASSQSSLSMESTTSGSQNHLKNTPSKTPSKSSNHHHHELPSHINAQLQPNSPLLKGKDSTTPDFYIIKVTYETDSGEKDGIVLYKSIMLCNNERTPTVIRNSMMKLSLEGDPDKFTLSQMLPDKDLLLPPNANVYYAVNTQFNLNFILRKKKDP